MIEPRCHGIGRVVDAVDELEAECNQQADAEMAARF
jgi:hypothetical protein